MKIPNMSPGITEFKGSIDPEKRTISDDKAKLGTEKQLASSSTSSGLIEYSTKEGTDLSSLFMDKPGESATGDQKRGLPGIASKLSDATSLIPGLSNTLKGVANSDGSLGGMLKGMIGGGVETVKNSVQGIVEGAMNGEINPAMMAKNAVAKNYENNEQTPEAARTLAKLV